MRKVLIPHHVVWVGLVILTSNLFVGMQRADARRNYERTFERTYTKVAKSNRIACSICHLPDNKKEHNIYGQAFASALGGEKVEDNTRIKTAFEAVEGKKSAIPNLTFGDLLRAGKLPASKK